MLSFFKSQQPATVLAFVLFFIVFKIPFALLAIQTPMATVQNLWNTEDIIIDSFLINFLLAQFCLLVQAIWFNYLFHKADYHEGSSMLPALYFTLITSLIPQFNEFSIYVILTFVLLALVQTFLTITIKDNARLECFNAGVLSGILIALNTHMIVFVPFLILILYAIKPFRFNDYLMLLFGVLFPVYMTVGIGYLINFEIDMDMFSASNFYFLRINNDTLNIINLLTAAVYVLFSFVSLRGIMYSTGFKRRKNLNMLIFLFVGITITIIFSGNLDESVFALLFIPVSIFLALFMLRIRKKRLGEILNAIFVLLILVVNIIRIFK